MVGKLEVREKVKSDKKNFWKYFFQMPKATEPSILYYDSAFPRWEGTEAKPFTE